jgi:PAS domain-containing protein
MDAEDHVRLLGFIVDRIEVGIFAVDREMRVVLWNNFMATHSGIAAARILGRNLFECFPELPRKWLEKKIGNVFDLKNYAFTSWEQRPYLFNFPHNRPITGGIDAMRQNCTFLPVTGADDEVRYVCVTVLDYTDTALFQGDLRRTISALDKLRNPV